MAKIRYPPRPRPKTRAEFDARQQEVWKELTDTWRGLPEAALVKPGVVGAEWSIKDVMNHLAAWHEVTLRSLKELVQGRSAGAGHTVDKFNALHAAADKNRSLAASRRRLNRTRRDVLAFVATLPDDEVLNINGRIGSWVKNNTYGHYTSHIIDLRDYRSRQLTVTVPKPASTSRSK
jgi:hypothetical protein